MAKDESTKLEKQKSAKPSRREKALVRDRMRNLLLFLPNMVRLLGSLLTDGRVPTADKALFAGAILYAVMPLDFIPDVLPFIGQMDDLYLIAITLLRLVNRTDETVVRQYWRGGGDIVALASSIASLAPALLPKRVSRVLDAHVELTPAAKDLSFIKDKSQPLVVEIPRTPAEIEYAKKP